jgi:hypothetical protein
MRLYKTHIELILATILIYLHANSMACLKLYHIALNTAVCKHDKEMCYYQEKLLN